MCKSLAHRGTSWHIAIEIQIKAEKSQYHQNLQHLRNLQTFVVFENGMLPMAKGDHGTGEKE